MANPDIAAALTVLATHLSTAGASLTDKLLDVDRGLPTGGRQLRYYWGGEVEPPKMPNRRTLNSELVGQRFIIAATWPLSDLSVEQVTAIDIEMQALTAAIRTAINGDFTLGDHVAALELGYADPDVVLISNTRHVALRWELDLAYLEYTDAP